MASQALVVNAAPLFRMRASADLGAECDDPHSTRFRPERLLIRDQRLGNIGLAQQARAQQAARLLVLDSLLGPSSLLGP